MAELYYMPSVNCFRHYSLRNIDPNDLCVVGLRIHSGILSVNSINHNDSVDIQLIRRFCLLIEYSDRQVLIKYLLLGDLHRLRPLFEFLKSVYQQNSWPNSKYYKTCMEFARISHLTLVIGFSLYSFIFAQIVLFGIYESLRRAEPTPFLFIFFPFASNDNLIVYILDLLYNTIAYLTCVVTVPPADLVFFIVFANVPLISTVICCQLNELSMIIQRDEVKPLNNNDIKRFLLNYVWMHRKYNE